MRILYCNKYDYRFSGTESYLFELIDQIDRRGHQSMLFTMDHGSPAPFKGRAYRIPRINFKDPTAGIWKKARLAAHALYSRSARRSLGHCIAKFSPEIAHIRSIYHHLSPSILWEFRRRGVPVLYHLNDFKIVCPSYNLVAHGEACHACRQGGFYHVITEDCYAGGRSSAVVLAAEAYLHKWLQTYQRCIDLFLAPSEFVRSELITNGFPADRIEVLPHFQALPAEDELTNDEGYLLYFGRLSPEKAVDELLHTLVRTPHIPVIIAGDGPERERLQGLAHELHLNRVLFAGNVDRKELNNLIARSSFTLFPSHAYETLGKSILESYAFARPVIASDLGSRREFVEHGVTGLLYKTGDREQLAHCIGFLFDRHDLIEKMGTNARARVKSNHGVEQHLEKLLGVYARLISEKKVLSFPTPSWQPRAPHSVRVAFIGGRGLVSKYRGIESYYEQAGLQLARLGHQVTVYCRDYFTPPINTHNGMRVRRLPTIRTKHLDTLVHTFISTLRVMASDNDIVHYHCLGPSLFSFLPRLVGKKTVVTVQGLDWQRAKWGRFASAVLRCGERAAVIFPNATMVVSKTLQNHYQESYRRETIYVPNGANTIRRPAPRYLREQDLLPDNYVLFLGRLSPEKNCHLLIEAFEKIRTEMKLVLAGGSSHTDSYVTNLRAHASERIRFLPWVSGGDLEQLLAGAALFALPSAMEGLSLALLDAMAARVCVLTSDIPENREVVDGTGFTFRSGDANELERMLDVLIRNPELRRQAGIRERDRIQKQYQWPEIALSIESVYHQVLGWPLAGVAAQEHVPAHRPAVSAEGLN
jgi:glycosyltransferase involved in cell wall biosynthesis